MGGTFPALIWASVISAWQEIKAEQRGARKAQAAEGGASEARRRRHRNRRTPNTRPRSEAAKLRSARKAKTAERRPKKRSRRREGERRNPGSRRPKPKRRRRSRAGSAAAAAASPPASRAGAQRPGGRGRETKRLPAAQKRQGRSTALVIPIRGPATTSGGAAVGRQQQERVAAEVGVVSPRPIPSASVSLPGPEQSSASGRCAAALAHRLQAGGRLQRADQHRRRLALRFGDRVEQAVDPVGEVDVGAAGRAEEDPGAVGEADVGVAGGVVALVALGLDDGAADAVEEEPAADQVAGDVVDRAVEEVSRSEPLPRLPARPGSRALRRPAP